MKRFYCIVCKKIKRVRQYPSNIVNPTHALPTERKGSCARHSIPVSSNYRKTGTR